MSKVAMIFNPFDANQKIYLINDDATVPAETSIPTEVAFTKICDMLNTVGGKEVLLKCPKQFAEKIANDIKQIAITKYNMNDITVMTVE